MTLASWRHPYTPAPIQRSQMGLPNKLNCLGRGVTLQPPEPIFRHSKGAVMRVLAGVLCALSLAGVVNGQTRTVSPSCEGLASLTLPHATITLARAVGSGGFTAPGRA